MAKILISYYSDYGETMYCALSQVLHDNGNNVMALNTNCEKIHINCWGGYAKTTDSNLINSILSFDPDLIFNFNFSLPLGIIDKISPSCKICILDADNPSTFWNKEYLHAHATQYFYLGLQSYSYVMYCKFLGIELTDQNYLYFPPATAIIKIPLKQDKNISFIGSNFYPLAIPEGEDFYSPVGLRLYEAIKHNYYLSEEEAIEICKGCSNPHWLLEKVRAYYVGQNRLKYMQVLTDLGFTFYGVRWWNHIAYYDFELAKCFDPSPKITLDDNQWVYNTSKISVNISHPQAKSSFSWRVMDIMASNSCLLMEEKKDWLDLFGKYLSKETLNHIIYKDQYDLREKAICLLKDEALRKRCVADLNHAIDCNGRWNHRLFMLERHFGMKLINGVRLDEPVIYIGNGLQNQAVIDEESKTKSLLKAALDHLKRMRNKV